jgi:hypothetical protein
VTHFNCDKTPRSGGILSHNCQSTTPGAARHPRIYDTSIRATANPAVPRRPTIKGNDAQKGDHHHRKAKAHIGTEATLQPEAEAEAEAQAQAPTTDSTRRLP